MASKNGVLDIADSGDSRDSSDEWNGRSGSPNKLMGHYKGLHSGMFETRPRRAQSEKEQIVCVLSVLGPADCKTAD